MKKLLAVLLLIGLAPLVLVACSSDSVTKEEYIAQADEICQKGDDDLDVLISDEFGTRMPNQQEIARFTEEVVIPNIEDQLVALRELEPPEGEEETTAEIYDTLSQGIEEYKADPDPNNLPPAIEEANRLARDFGLEVCGRS